MNRDKYRRPKGANEPDAVPPCGLDDSGYHRIAGYDIDSYQEVKRNMASEPLKNRTSDDDHDRSSD